MYWPDTMLILDDELPRATELKNLIADLSWIVDPDVLGKKGMAGDLQSAKEELSKVPASLYSLAEVTPHFFSDKVRLIRIKQDAELAEALEALKVKNRSVLFLDWFFSDSEQSVLDQLSSIYNTFKAERGTSAWHINRPWKNDGFLAGYVFLDLFGAQRDDPIRLICPVTISADEDVVRTVTKGACTKKYNLHKGYENTVSAIVGSLTKWIELSNKCPLAEIWETALENEWFTKRNCSPTTPPSIGFMPHDLPNTYSEHRGAVQDLLDLELPESWWQTAESANIIHQALKYMCGLYYCGTPLAGTDSTHNLKMSSVYLISLLAFRDAMENREISLLTKTISDLSKYRGLSAPFLWLQDEEDARKSAEVLYFFLRAIFRRVEEHDNAQLETLAFSQDGRELRFTFARNWPIKGLRDKVLGIYRDYTHERVSLINYAETQWPDSPVYAFVGLWHLILHDKGGLGSPGQVEFCLDGHTGKPTLCLRSTTNR